jgi:hypothetical protein
MDEKTKKQSLNAYSIELMNESSIVPNFDALWKKALRSTVGNSSKKVNESTTKNIRENIKPKGK